MMCPGISNLCHTGRVKAKGRRCAPLGVSLSRDSRLTERAEMQSDMCRCAVSANMEMDYLG